MLSDDQKRPGFRNHYFFPKAATIISEQRRLRFLQYDIVGNLHGLSANEKRNKALCTRTSESIR